MDPDHDRPATPIRGRCPDIQRQAVLALGKLHPALQGFERRRELRRDRPGRPRLTHTAPWLTLHRGTEAQRSHRGAGVGNATKHFHAVGSKTPYTAGAQLNKRLARCHLSPHGMNTVRPVGTVAW
jgi:hypothetical protein